MQLTSQRLVLTKRYPLTISRGTITGSVNVLVRVEHDGVVGWGEGAPNDVSGDTTESIETDVARISGALDGIDPSDGAALGMLLEASGAGGAARAAVDIAWHDWWGVRAGQPLWRLWGIPLARRNQVAPTSLTIGMAPVGVLANRVPEIVARTGARALKVKLGGSGGIDSDKEMFAAVQHAAGDSSLAWRVDANGGWSPDDAIEMDRWLAERNVEYVEQPLPAVLDAELRRVVPHLRLPVFLDESITTWRDVALVVGIVAGVNLKLMKCGGMAQGRRIIDAARAANLDVMIGCMGESSLAITAGAHLAPLVDHVDLDSHFNLIDDPFVGAQMIEGRVVAPDAPGLGVQQKVDPCQ
jgi:L-Ala-D/L-Glu epimerase